MEVLLNGQPKLIRQFNQFLPKNCQIYVKEGEEKQQRKVEELV
jgi:histone deacetylase complex regulatory component SIN3